MPHPLHHGRTPTRAPIEGVAGADPLGEWFRDLWPTTAQHGGILTRSAETARMLLAEPREVGVLHGDLHHDNVLDFGARGWLASTQST